MKRQIFTAVAATVLVLVPAISANAATTNSAPDPTYYRNWLTQYGVVGATQDRLVAQLEAGGLPESLDSKARPVSSRETATDTAFTTVYTYSDGSILVSTRERPPASSPSGMHTNTISGCKAGSGSGFATYSNCLISNSNSYATLSFRATYEQYTGGAQIDSAPQSSASVTVHYGDSTAPTVSIKRAKQSGSLEAYAQEHSKYTSWTGQESEDLYLSLRVLTSKAWTTDY